LNRATAEPQSDAHRFALRLHNDPVSITSADYEDIRPDDGWRVADWFDAVVRRDERSGARNECTWR